MSCPKKINQNSALAFNNALNIFSVPPTNVSVNKSYFREILPLSTISQDSPYLFRLFNDNLWTDLSRIYLFIEVSIEKRTGNTWIPIVAADTDIGSTQLIGLTFIEQLKVTISNQDVYDSGTLYPYRAYIVNELSHSSNVKKNFLASAGYYQTDEHDKNTDDGFKTRCKLFAEGKKSQFLSRLDFDLGNQELYLLNNIDILFTIYRSKDSFILQTLKDADANVYRLFLHDIKLYAKMIDVQPSLNMSIYTALEKQPATYSVRKTEITKCFLTAGRTEIIHNAFSTTIPRRLTIAFVSQKAFNGDITLSPFKFLPYDIRDISVNAGGTIYPIVPYKLDFSKNECIKAFVDLYEALGAANSEQSFDLSLDKFKAGFTFFVIPMTSTLDDSCGFELVRSGSTTIRVQFNKAIPADGIEMIILGEFDQMILVDYQRHIVSDSTIA